MRKALFNLYSWILNRYFRLKGITMPSTAYISKRGLIRIGKGRLILDEYAQINPHCFLLNVDTIKIGKNSTLAYQTTILTSANPNAPYIS